MREKNVISMHEMHSGVHHGVCGASCTLTLVISLLSWHDFHIDEELELFNKHFPLSQSNEIFFQR